MIAEIALFGLMIFSGLLIWVCEKRKKCGLDISEALRRGRKR